MEWKSRKVPGGRGDSARVVVAALMMLVCFASRARASGQACQQLPNVPASDLLAIQGLNSFDEGLPPGVQCTTAGLDPKSTICASRRTIIHDQVIDGRRRLLIVRAANSKEKRDHVFVFGCVGGRVQAVLQYVFFGRVKVASASLDKIIIKGDTLPNPRKGSNRTVFYWDARLQAYAFSPSAVGPSSAGPGLKCSELGSAKASKLIAVPRNGFTHGFGCYSEAPINYPSSCDWRATLGEDRMLGKSRRLIVVTDSHQTGTGAWGYLYVFSCVGGRIRVVFDDHFRWGVSVEEASPKSLTISVLAWGPHDCDACASMVKRMRYSWDPELQSYILRSVRITPAKR